MIDVETFTDMSCQGLQSFPLNTMAESLFDHLFRRKIKIVSMEDKNSCFSAKPTWNMNSRDSKCSRKNNITCGILPTLRALASRECNDQGSVCLVPLDVDMDAAIHLQMILLEAYCREIGIRVSRVPLNTLQDLLGPGHSDLSCVLIDDPYFMDPPE
ncbi:hypothetical protein M0804_001914 [Polistes exclamans]|nr:hypothetical protein M0804_001914 [Polistes exclamans]